MNINKYTIKSQEALQSAVELARKGGNQAIEPAHLLESLLSLGDSLTDFLLSKLAIQRPRLEDALRPAERPPVPAHAARLDRIRRRSRGI